MDIAERNALEAIDGLFAVDVNSRLKKLAEEVFEFTEAVLTKSDDHVRREAGDVLLIILHILSIKLSDDFNLGALIMDAALKAHERAQNKEMKLGIYIDGKHRNIRSCNPELLINLIRKNSYEK